MVSSLFFTWQASVHRYVCRMGLVTNAVLTCLFPSSSLQKIRYEMQYCIACTNDGCGPLESGHGCFHSASVGTYDTHPARPAASGQRSVLASVLINSIPDHRNIKSSRLKVHNAQSRTSTASSLLPCLPLPPSSPSPYRWSLLKLR